MLATFGPDGLACLDDHPCELMVQRYQDRVESGDNITDVEWDVFACFLRGHLKGEPLWLVRKLGGFVLHGVVLKASFHELRHLIADHLQGTHTTLLL